MNKDEFISQAQVMHGCKYDYSKVEFINKTTKVCIICPEHGEFWQTPSNHLRGEKCPICAQRRNSLTKEEFIEKAKQVHGDKYDYSKVQYTTSTEKVCIICPKHGEFWQTPASHLNKNGCLKCKSMSVDDFVERARQVHGNKYDYSKVEYKNCDTKVCIICPEHGEFWQTPYTHLKGCRCPICANHIVNQDLFIQKADKKWKNRYDYSKVDYRKANECVCIICHEHGEFWQTPNSHLSGRGCPKCGVIASHKSARKTNEEFIAEARTKHGDEYDYSKVEYINNKTKVCIICPRHGEFMQNPSKHIDGQGCPICRYEKVSLKNSYSQENVLVKFREVHGYKYDYSKVQYVGYEQPVCIICPEHGEFWQTPDVHLRGCGCPKCANKESRQEVEISRYVKDLIGEDNVLTRQRNLLSSAKEIDIYVPSRQIAIEYNGLFWHTEQFGKDKNYHLSKLEECNLQGIRLIHIFEDEYTNYKDLVFNKIKHILGLNGFLPKISARKCIIQRITSNIAKEFLEKNNIQGFADSTIHLGCFWQDLLVGVMSFRERNIQNKWEMIRFAVDVNYIVQGCASRMLNFFIKEYKPHEIESFADKRWVDKDNNLYLKLGFVLDSSLEPNYTYFNTKYGIIRFNSLNLKQLYSANDLDNYTTESEMASALDFYKIWDCGLYRYVLDLTNREL